MRCVCTRDSAEWFQKCGVATSAAPSHACTHISAARGSRPVRLGASGSEVDECAVHDGAPADKALVLNSMCRLSAIFSPNLVQTGESSLIVARSSPVSSSFLRLSTRLPQLVEPEPITTHRNRSPNSGGGGGPTINSKEVLS